jgi:conjugal transfer pilus assembly protein TraK
MKRLLNLIVMTAVLVLGSSNAFALKVLEGAEGKKHAVDIPANELTRIGVDGQKMKGFRFKLDELEVDQDKEAGAVYIQPLVKDKNISVFVVSSTGATHELILRPVLDLPLESIVIREPGFKAKARSAGGSGSIEKAGALEVSVKRLILAMAKEDDSQPDISYDKVNVPMVLWKESQFVMVGKFATRSLIGESFKLLNTSGKPMRVAEQELFKPGVVAVSVESQILRSGEETNVFVVRVNRND